MLDEHTPPGLTAHRPSGGIRGWVLIATSALPVRIQAHSGHSSILVTMDRYGHLFPSDMEALDEVRSEALADQMRTKRGPDVIQLTSQ